MKIDLQALVAETPAEELPRLVGSFAEGIATALAQLANTTTPRTHPDPSDDRLLAMPEVAERLGIKEHQARELGRRGEIPTVTVGERHVRVRASALAAWIRKRERSALPGSS